MAPPTAAPMPDESNANLHDDQAEKKAAGTEVRAEPADDREVTRQGEAGNAYVGREMDERLKANPRIEDADKVEPDDAKQR